MKPIVLQGEDAIRFREQMLHPDTSAADRIREETKDWEIYTDEDGTMNVSIPDLDLSCLDDEAIDIR